MTDNHDQQLWPHVGHVIAFMFGGLLGYATDPLVVVVAGGLFLFVEGSYVVGRTHGESDG